MNYITINGIKSNSVKGLIIQSLPPITKPKIRTTIEEIDGRDGDVITKLGYSAYDKEVSIGLYGDFDIDDCIRYFDSEGTVVFSNEPDKYYKFTIIDQIDFERLIRFRTAKVKFHVQPFKYSDVDKKIELKSENITLRKFAGVLNGLSVEADTTISLKGTATKATEFYIPINPIQLKNGSYTFSVKCDGTAKGASIRLIADRPSDSTSFGNGYLSIADNSTVTKSSNDEGQLIYNYAWLYIPQGTVLNGTLTLSLKGSNITNLDIDNRGNTISRPKITIYGYGTVEIYLNALHSATVSKLTVKIDDEFITIDTEDMNAYNGFTLKNRNVSGDYSKFVAKQGLNTLYWNVIDGEVDKIIVENFSRWI